MRQHLKFIAAAVAALALIGCKFATDTPAATPSAEFRAEATGGQRVARAAVDAAAILEAARAGEIHAEPPAK